ncbi:Motile sperm domain-containing protein 2-like protein [Leptotrombidium deliense]|uniref:Motile sperm domain-containing protein 2-like protein n=1 Tax=Leptotrombidium deliense TaxID=299467 RepID=A0A443S559_9ACAR|nr:Motile sperm domain-containing protein 2-like protein [Leptotrombidium deliense]
MSIENGNQQVVYTNRSAHLVKNVREMFMEEYERDKNQFFDEDVEKIMNDDWFVKRFLIARGRNVKNTSKMLIAAMRWRKNEDVRNTTMNMFPAAFHQIGGLFRYRDDKEGNAVIYFRIKYLFRIPEVSNALKKYGAFIMYKLDEDVHNSTAKGFTGVIDFAGTGMKNCELGMLRYCITILTQYMPAGVNHILVANLPSILRAFWFTTKGWIPENRRKLVQFVNSETITEFIDSENLPKFLGGTCKQPYRGDEVVPDNCISIMDFAISIGVDVARAKEIHQFYEPYLEEED